MNATKRPVLILNAAWLPIGTRTAKRVLEKMNSAHYPLKALKIEYNTDEHGNPNYEEPVELLPLGWDEWITLAPREYDEHIIHTPRHEIRLPTVAIVGSGYDRLPIKTFRPSKRHIYDRYGGKDFWTGEELSYKDCTLDHIVPRAKGGKNTWQNLAPTSGKINRLKSDMSAEEFIKKYGYKPHYKLTSPAPVAAEALIQVLNPDWAIFLNKHKR